MKKTDRKNRIRSMLLTAALVLGGGAMGSGNLLSAQAAGRPVSIYSCQISGGAVVWQRDAARVPCGADPRC